LAAIRGRDFPTPDDVRDIAPPVLRHRLALRAEAELDGATTDAVISDILKTVEVPR
jgi:MoxR-like ATPase